jgi:replicative DNA helicase
MLRLARGFAEQGHRVAWLAAEMQPRALVRRMLCQSAGLGQAALLSESMPADHARLLADAGKRLAAIEQRIEFTTAPIGFDEIDRAAEAADVVFVDYLQLLQHPEPSARGHERIEDAMARIAAAAQRTGAAFVLAAAQGRDGGGEVRELHNAVRGSSAVEFTVDALYSATAPSDRERGNPAGITIEFKCLKQREGALLPLEVAVDGRTGLLAKDASQ